VEKKLKNVDHSDSRTIVGDIAALVNYRCKYGKLFRVRMHTAIWAGYLQCKMLRQVLKEKTSF
jgi:hypothetical protein